LIRLSYIKNYTNIIYGHFVYKLKPTMGNIFRNGQTIYLEKIGSTNTYISKIAHSLPEGSVVWTINQTNGRGQAENKWESEPNKNLTFSIVLNPQFLQASQQFYMSKVIALGITDFISLHTDNVSIKWPNDIFVGDKKIAGILIENAIERTYIKQTISGIGINLNQTKFSSNAPNPTSLALLTGQKYDIESSLFLLIDLIEYRYSLLKNSELKTIDTNFNEILYRNNQLFTYVANGKAFEGTILGVEPTGELIIKDKSGKIHKFLHKEVEFTI